MNVLLKGVEAGDTDYYLRHVDTNHTMYTISDMLITSNASEMENPEYKKFRLIDVSELNEYYKCSD